MSCPGCEYPNDKDFRFCQRCGYRRQTQTAKTWPYLKAAVNWEVINERKRELNQRVRSTPYSRQKSSLENELSAFLRKSTPSKDIITATPDDVIHFLIWKDSFGKTIVHKDNCPHFGDKKKSSCSCPRRLAFSTVDSMIGKLRSIFAQMGRTLDDASLPGYGNPAASIKVKLYLTSMREEQLCARSLPSQAQPFFLQDLIVLSEEIVKRLSRKSNTPTQLFVYTRDQAFFKIQFFAGDRAGDLGRTKTMGLLFSPNKDILLFNHTLTKSLRDGTTNMFALKRNSTLSILDNPYSLALIKIWRVTPVLAISCYNPYKYSTRSLTTQPYNPSLVPKAFA